MQQQVPNKVTSTLTDDSGNKSSMRIMSLILVIASSLVIGAIAFFIIYRALKDGKVDWAGLAIFFGGFGTYIALLLSQKVRQKKVENENISPAKKNQSD